MIRQTIRTASLAAAVAVLAVGVAACGSSPTAPGEGATIVLAQQQTATVPDTDLRITADSLVGPELILCIAVIGSPCGQSPHATLRVEVPGAAPRNLGMQVPGPEGAVDRFSYEGYTVRLAGLEPAWNREAPLPTSRYRLVLVVTRE